MSTVWRNLELLEETYEQIFLKTHRIQANRVCLGDLTGEDFQGGENSLLLAETEEILSEAGRQLHDGRRLLEETQEVKS